MSNKLKIILAVITSILVLSGSAIIFNSQRRNSQTPASKIESSSSSSTVSFSSSSQVSSVSISSSSVESSSVSVPSSEITKIDIPITSQVAVSQIPIIEKPKSAVIPQSQTVINNPTQTVIQDVSNVTKLSTDTSIYHQYIRDYLACPTKFYQTLNGGYKFEGEIDYKYLCIPQAEADKCPRRSLLYGLKHYIGQEMFTYESETIRSERNIKNLSGISKEPDIIEQNKYYCQSYTEGQYSVTLPENYYPQPLLTDLNSNLKGYFVITKANIPDDKKQIAFTKVTFAAIPISSFSKTDQEYIAKNFTVK